MKYIIKLITIVGFFYSVMTVAAPGDELVTLLSKMNTVTANFVQVPLTKKKQLQQKSTGTMAIAKPNRFRWEIMNPSHQLIIADGKQVWYYDIDLQQVIVQSLDKSIGASPAMLLSGDSETLVKDYHVKRSQNGEELIYQLIPKNNSSTFKSVDLYFVKGTLMKMRLADNLGQQSMVTFSTLRLNPALNPQRFQFSVPQGVDVIRK